MATYRVPDVYVERRPRVREVPATRTDVVGFIGLEPRFRAGALPFRVDIAGFQVESAGRRARIAATVGFDLLHGSAVHPISNGEAIVFALVAVVRASGPADVVIVRGDAAAAGQAIPPTDPELESHVGATDPWLRLVDVVATKSAGHVALTIRPRLGPVRCDDWNDYIAKLGVPADDGMLLGLAARFYFANGGSRAWIGTVSRPPLDDANGLADVLDEIVGVRGTSEERATGLERLLLVPEVSIVDVPDLHTRRVVTSQEPDFVLPRDVEADFTPCANVFGSVHVASVSRTSVDPIFSSTQVTSAQCRMLERCLDERWRVLLLFSPPLERDPVDGGWRTPSDVTIKAWASELAAVGDVLERSCAALYAPWVLAQDGVDAPVIDMPPTPFVAGVIARRDLSRGPQIAPANEVMRGVVGLADDLSDERFAALYDEPPFINLLRPFPGDGVRVWGSRTLSTDAWLRWVPVRRCLSAIERRMRDALLPIVFEPNTPALWLQVTHLALATLVPLFESGALRGETPEEAFYVRCGPSNNPPDAIQNGLLVCEVGVAVAAPSEFVVFRLGRREGVVEVLE
jgi:uncharacterized protein